MISKGGELTALIFSIIGFKLSLHFFIIVNTTNASSAGIKIGLQLLASQFCGLELDFPG
jgi:hypothetical protein